MEGDDVMEGGPDESDGSEDSKEPELWRMFRSTIPSFFSDSEKINKGQIEQFLHNIIAKEHYDRIIFIPQLTANSEDLYYERFKSYIEFTLWFLGQLIRMLSTDRLSYTHKLSVAAQTTLLNLFANMNIEMLRRIIQEYIKFINGLLCAVDKFSADRDTNEYAIDCFLYNFTITPGEKSFILLEQMLTVIKSQCYILSECAPDSVCSIWSVVIKVFSNMNPITIITTVQLTATLISMNSLPGICETAVLCEKIGLLIQFVVNVSCSSNSSKSENNNSINEMLNAFNDLFSALTKLRKCNLDDMSHFLLKMLSPLLKQNNPFITSKLVAPNTCKLLSILLNIQPSEDHTIDIKQLNLLINDINICQNMMPILEIFCQSEIAENLNNLKSNENEERKTFTLAKDLSCTLCNVLNLLSKHLNKLNELNLEEYTNLLKLMNSIAKSVSNIIANCDKEFNGNSNSEQPMLCLLGEQVYHGFVTVILKFVDVCMVADFEAVKSLFEISSILLLLPDISYISNDLVKKLIAFQSLPWWKYNYLVKLNLYDSSFQDVLETFINHQDSVFQVDRIKKLCLSTLGRLAGDIGIEWRLELFSSYFNENQNDNADVLLCIPFILRNCRFTLPTLIHTLLQPALESSYSNIQLILPEVISHVLCVLSGTTFLERSTNENVVEIKCTVCDLSEEQEATVSCDELRPLMNSFLNLFTATSPQVLCKVISVLPRLANHLPFIHTPECVKRWIVFVKNPNVHVRDMFSKVALDLVFRKNWVEQRKQNSEEDLPLSQADRQELVNSEPLLEEFNKQVMSAVRQSIQSREASLQLTVMSTIRNMGRAPVDCVIYPCVKMLLIYISHPYSVKPSIAEAHLQAIADAHNKTVLDVFEKYRGEFCKLIVDLLILYSPDDKNDLTCFIQQLANALTYYSCRNFLMHNASDPLLKYLLMSLVNKPELDWILEHFAELTSTSVSVLVTEGFKNVYPYLYMEADKSVLDDCCKYMESVTGHKIQSLICLSFKRISNEILLYYNTNAEKVMEALKFIMQFTNEGQPSLESDGDVVEFLVLRFLGVLNFMEGVLVSTHKSDTDKRNVLLALPAVIKLMGPAHITPVRLKVLAMLRAALTICHGFFPDLTCAAWEAFIHNVEVSALGSLLSTIFVSMLPLLENFPEEVGRMFHYLVVENEDTVSNHFEELFFVPNLSPIRDVYIVIQRKIKQEVAKMSFIEQLQSTLKVAKHENVEVRLQGLNKLRCQVITNWVAISDLIINNDSLHPVIIDFLDALISGTRDEEERIRIACGECLGELGALDPGRLPNNLLARTVYNKNYSRLEDIDFAYSALMTLVKGFQEARYTVSMDEISLAIQELLKIYKISPKSKDSWNRFPSSVQERMLPFLNTRYVQNTSLDRNITDRMPHPIFGSYRGKTMMSWAYNWASFLIPLATQTDHAQRVFKACQFSCKRDASIMMFFLPYILLHALFCCSETDKKLIEEEIRAVICYSDNNNEQCDVNERKAMTFRVRKGCITNDNPSEKEDSTTQMMCIKIMYSLLDFLYQWLRETEKSCSAKPRLLLSNKEYHTISEFLDRFSLLDIANGSFSCQEYSRSLLYMEEYVAKHPDKLEELLLSFGKIYYQLNEPDGLKGVIDTHQYDPTPDEMLLYHVITGQLHDAATCYERLAAREAQQSAQYDKNLVKGMVDCYLSMDQPFTALHISESLLSKRSDIVTTDLRGEQAEALWNMGRMDQLESMFQNSQDVESSSSWGVNIARAMVHLKQLDEPSMFNKLNLIRKGLVDHLLSTSAMSAGGYKQGYDYIVRLHILNEFEKVGKLVLNLLNKHNGGTGSSNIVNSSGHNDLDVSVQFLELQFISLVTVKLDERLKLLQPSSRVLQPVLCMRRVLLSLAENMIGVNHPNVSTYLKEEIGKCWLKSISVARVSNNFQQAYSNILTAEQLKPKGLFIEKAKLHWAKSEKDAALTILKRGIEQTFSSLFTSDDKKFALAQMNKTDRKLLAKAKLLIATYNDENVNVEMETNLSSYSEAVEACKDWEKSLICLAQCQYKIFSLYNEKQMVSEAGLECQEKLVKYFGQSLQYGCKYIYQSMPRMLSIWLDYGTRLAHNLQQRPSSSPASSSQSNLLKNIIEQKKTMTKLNNLIEQYVNKLPLFMFMICYSQLLSRICHQQADCYELLKNILARIIKNYPEQSLWLFVAISKSKHVLRVKRCQEVLHDQIIQSDKPLLKYISCMKQLHDCLIDFGHTKYGEGTHASFSELKCRLPQLLKQSSFCQMLLPLQKFMTVTLPRSNEFQKHNPYPQKMVYIHDVKNEVIIYPSLQKPKRFTVIGSDGLEYMMMVKVEDDLRLDARLMDFFHIINMYLQRDAEARDRRLHIRTYSVVALSDNSGLIEWIPNLTTSRFIVLDLYKQINVNVTSRELKSSYYSLELPLEQKRQHFIDVLLKKFPPVLRKWFLQEFPHPTSWYQARTAYIRTTAVMSMVGYIVGLGDRHNDNILFDNNSGEIIHVDFNCCCNTGEGFQWPERVPFRLTHNMVDAMGPTGYEGTFIRSCEITMRVMRQQIEQLISVLKPLIYDAVIKKDENKLKKLGKSVENENCERRNETNVKRLNDIQLRLQGSLRIIPKNQSRPIAKQTPPLSVEGLTRSVILQATDIDNLCQMFIGWSSFM